MVPENCMLLRVFIGETDKHKGRPLYEAIVYKARELDLAGATVLRGILGYGADSRIHSSKLLALSDDLPVVVEVVDSEEKVRGLLPFLDEAVEEGLVTLEPVTVYRYRHNRSDHRGRP